MKRFLLTLALAAAATGATLLPSAALADHGHRGGYGGHGHHHGHHHAHRPSGYYHPYQRQPPVHYDLYWHGDHYDAVPHAGYHHYSHRPSYGYQYGGYSRGGINLNGISVRW